MNTINNNINKLFIKNREKYRIMSEKIKKT